MMQGGVSLHYKQCQTSYLKEFTYRKMGINRSIYFIQKSFKLDMTNGCIGMDWYMSGYRMVYYKGNE